MTPREFQKQLRLLRKHYTFRLFPSGVYIPACKPGWEVVSHPIYYVSPQLSFWSPLQVLAIYLKRPDLWYSSDFEAGKALGIPTKLLKQIIAATREYENHNPTIRKRLLQSLNLSEVPHKQRKKRKVKNGQTHH